MVVAIYIIMTTVVVGKLGLVAYTAYHTFKKEEWKD